jgi:hypothetical protein
MALIIRPPNSVLKPAGAAGAASVRNSATVREKPSVQEYASVQESADEGLRRIPEQSMRLKVEMTLNAATAKRFRETAERLTHLNAGDDGLLAAVVLLRIADSYDRAAKAANPLPIAQLNAENDE